MTPLRPAYITLLLLALLLTASGLPACDTAPSAQSEKNESPVLPKGPSEGNPEVRPGEQGFEREEIRYVMTVIPPSMAKAPARLESLLDRLGIPRQEAIRVDADNEIAVPRATYREFLDRLAKHGRLRVARERFTTRAPADAPVPFVIRFSEQPPEASPGDEYN